jgi:hypothetical protein
MFYSANHFFFYSCLAIIKLKLVRDSFINFTCYTRAYTLLYNTTVDDCHILDMIYKQCQNHCQNLIQIINLIIHNMQ